MSRVIVVGGGAAGLLAAGRAAEQGASVLLLEKTPRLGNKLRISGQGRGNITTTDSLADFVTAFGPAGRFLYGAGSRFFRDDLLALLRELGVDTVTERGGRVFPASQHAPDVAEALIDYARRGGVQVRTRCPVQRLLVQDGRVAGVQTAEGRELAGAVIVAVGGASYPGTGSTGDGVALARAVGHVTAGGVDLDQVDPRTLMSRLVPGLFFAGEVLDLDGPTGGYNLQAAFSTGYVAGQAAAG